MTADTQSRDPFHALEALSVPEAARRLVRVRDSLATTNDPDALIALAKALPTRVAKLAPEVSSLVAEIAASLVASGPTIPRDLDAIEVAFVRIAWLRVALAAGDEATLGEGGLDEATLLLVLASFPPATGWADALRDPRQLFRRLAGAIDPRLRAMALERIEPAVLHLALPAEEAFAVLDRLASDPEPSVREAVVRLLARFWLADLSAAQRRIRDAHVRRALRDSEPQIARAALDATIALAASLPATSVSAAALASPRRWLVDLLAEPVPDGAPASEDAAEGVRVATQIAALDALGAVAEASDIDLALDLAAADGFAFGPPARRFLLEAHRHGVFLRDAHVDRVLAVFDAHAAWTGEELVRVTYIARRALVAHLAAMPLDDPRWIRRAAILGASVGPEAAEVLASLLERLDPSAPRTWSIASSVVRAAGASASFAREDLLLRFLDVVPEDVLPSLRAKGGPLAATRLRALVRDPFTTPSYRARTMEILWALAHDRRALLTELAAALPLVESGALETKYLASRDSIAAEILANLPPTGRPSGEAEDPALAPLARLTIFCESGDVRFLGEVERLYREIVRSYVRKALAGDFTIKRVLMPELEQLVFRYGRHLVKDGRPVRRFVADEGPETGRDLVLRFVTDWLTDVHEAPSDPIVVALLEAASRHAPDGPYLRKLEPFWRRGDVNVKRAAIEALVASGGGARGLELSLGRLVADEALDPRVLTQALAAVRTFRAAWAEPLVLRVLERREMAVKKEAADALAEIGSARAVGTLVDWLGRHDNASFRTSLLHALVKSAGPALVRALVDALVRACAEPGGGEPRTRELLLEALSTRIDLATVVRLARSDETHVAHRAIVDAALEGTLTVVGATRTELAAHLHRAKLRVKAAKDDPTKRLRVEGFSPPAARELVARRRTKDGRADASIVAIVRSSLAEWLRWLTSSDVVDADAVALVVDAAERANLELLPSLLALVEREAPRLAKPEGVVDFCERALLTASPSAAVDAAALEALRLRAVALVRALPPNPAVGGARRWRLLGRLGAVRTISDLEASLRACDGAPNVASESRSLLVDVFAIPPPPPTTTPLVDRDRELEALYEEAATLYRRSPSERHAWLTRVAASRPIDVRAASRPPRPPPKSPSTLTSTSDYEDVLAVMDDPSRPTDERERAAARLLDWPDAAERALPAARTAYLAGRLDLPGRAAILAASMTAWPAPGAVVDAPAPNAPVAPTHADSSHGARVRRDRLASLASRLTPGQLRVFVPEWLAFVERAQADLADPDVARGLAVVDEWVAAIGQDRLLPFVIARARAGHFASVRLVKRLASRASPPAVASAAIEALATLTKEHSPADAAHLVVRPESDAEPAVDDSSDPIDPIDGHSLEALVALLATKGVEKGLAVRAVHALARRFPDRASAPLARLAVDRRPPIRSAALRALRTVATREQTLEVTAQALAIETRRDVALSLMASLGHGRHEPSLPGLLERLTDRDTRIRDGARAALLAWGREIVPALRHAFRRARPDRRAVYETLIAELSA